MMKVKEMEFVWLAKRKLCGHTWVCSGIENLYGKKKLELRLWSFVSYEWAGSRRGKNGFIYSKCDYG